MNNRKMKREKFFLWVIILAFIDQITKLIVILNKEKFPITLINGVLDLEYTENRGIAFGLGNGTTILIGVVTAIIIAMILVVINKNYNKFNNVLLLGGILLLSGGIANLLDRIFRLYVVDFIYFKLIDFPVFNFADICIVIGVMVICFGMFIKDRGENFEENKGNE